METGDDPGHSASRATCKAQGSNAGPSRGISARFECSETAALPNRIIFLPSAEAARSWASRSWRSRAISLQTALTCRSRLGAVGVGKCSGLCLPRRVQDQLSGLWEGRNSACPFHNRPRWRKGNKARRAIRTWRRWSRRTFARFGLVVGMAFRTKGTRGKFAPLQTGCLWFRTLALARTQREYSGLC